MIEVTNKTVSAACLLYFAVKKNSTSVAGKKPKINMKLLKSTVRHSLSRIHLNDELG